MPLIFFALYQLVNGCKYTDLSQVIRGSRAKVRSMPIGTILLGFPLKRRRSRIEESAVEKKSGTLRHRSPTMKGTTAIRNWLGARATARPQLEEPPLPPKNLRKMGQHCPATAATPAMQILQPWLVRCLCREPRNLEYRVLLGKCLPWDAYAHLSQAACRDRSLLENSL